jgi:hypothetical protein
MTYSGIEMVFLVELDHLKSGAQLTPEAARSFVEQVIFPTLAGAEQLSKERKRSWLVDTKTTSSGIVVMLYEPVG